MGYREYKNLDLTEIADEVLAFWKERHIYDQSISNREGAKSFVFFEGPPSANGMPGIHHALGRTIKDIFCRYKTLKGYKVERKSGWDTHGLPVELQVEKRLGIKKEDIGVSISVAEYNEECRKDVMKFTDVWMELTEKLGYWIDQTDPYITYEKKYIETLWQLLKRLYDKDLLYKGFTIQPYSPAAGTGLSSHELNQPGTYRPVKDSTAVAMFKIVGTDNEYFLAWTTTPWTLPSNTALAVGENITYVKVYTINPYTLKPIKVILAKEVFNSYFEMFDVEKELPRVNLYSIRQATTADDIKFQEATGNFIKQTLISNILDSFGNLFYQYTEDNLKYISEYLISRPGNKINHWFIESEFLGRELEGARYEQLMPYVQPDGDAFKVIAGDFVTTEDGTGIVHIAPTFGADDMRVAAKNNIPSLTVTDPANPRKQIPLVDKTGKFVDEVTDFAGRYVKDYIEDPNYVNVDIDIITKLKKEGRLFKSEKYEHNYPHCWRTDKPVLYYPLEAWFIRTTAYKQRMMELNNTINWKPASTGTGRFGNWLENLVDWNLSRSRFWGTPLPIWLTEDGAEEKCIGSIAELEEEVAKAIKAGYMENPLPNNFDLHRPYVDEVTLVSDSGKPMYRTPDVIDVWFDSGAMPYAQWHWPFENIEKFEQHFPADFIAEGVDQTRGWFFTLHALASMLFDSVAFKNVVSNGLVLDKDGNKMSKRLGNVVDPFAVLKQYGPDAARYYMVQNSQPWDNLKFDLDGMDELRKKFFGTLYNVYSFFSLYANIDGFTYKEEKIAVSERQEIDRWIISQLQSLVIEVEDSYEQYEPTRAARAIYDFVIEHLSNWYVRLCRRRFWKGDYTADKIAAYQTLYECLETVCMLAAPIAPFYTDHLFRDLNSVTGRQKAESVHLTDFPEADKAAIDKDLEERMQMAHDISSMVLSLRKKSKIRVRQPLARIMVPVLDDKMVHQLDAVKELIISEVNVKNLEYLTDTSGMLVKSIKPDFKKLGPKYGQKMKEVQQAVLQMSKEDIASLEQNSSFELVLSSQTMTLLIDEVEIVSEDIPGWLVANEGKLTVALDVTLSPDLINEGMARELVNRIQQMRKNKNFEVTDHIDVQVENLPEVAGALHQFKNYICSEILADTLVLADSMNGDAEIVEIEELNLKIAIKRS